MEGRLVVKNRRNGLVATVSAFLAVGLLFVTNPEPFSCILHTMSRVHRLRLSDRIFFVTMNLRRTLPAFTEAEFALILKTPDESRRRLDFALCGYVLMPEHWHALLWPRDHITISNLVRDVKSISARRLNRHRQSHGPVWQHQFWDRFVRHAKEYGQRLNYIHSNPVRKGLVAKPEDWQWSSFNNFSLNKSVRGACPIEIDYVELPDSYRG